MMFKSLNGLASMYLHELLSERHTDYDLRDSFSKLNLPILTIWNVASATAVRYCGILFLKVLGRSDHLRSLRRKSTARTWNIRFPLGNLLNQFF